VEEIDVQHKQTYSKEAISYDSRRFASRRGRLHNYYEIQAIARLLEPLEGLRVLDMPSGTARIALELCSRGAEVIGVDLSPEMLKAGRDKARRSTRNGRTTFVNGNGRRLAFASNSFDAITCIRFFHLLPPADWSDFLDEMRRVMKPDGQMIVQLFNPLYGGPLALLREVYRRVTGQPGEGFVWPHQLKGVFSAADLEVATVTSFWLPGMGFLGKPGSPLLNQLSRICEKRPLSWIAGPHLVLARCV